MAHDRRFRFAAQLSKSPDGSALSWAAQARRAEDLGYSALLMPDHFGDQFAPVPALAAVAAATSTLRMGALVFCNDYRHPFVLAKEAATLDVLSDGRFELSLGAGWMRSDYDEAGLPYDHPAVRVARFEEAVKVVQGLLHTDGPFHFHGEHYEVLGHTLTPRPVQQPGPPLIIGGGGKRVLSFAARHADIVSINVNLREGTGGARDRRRRHAGAHPHQDRLGQGGGGRALRRPRAQLAHRFRPRHRRRGGPGGPDGARLRHRPGRRVARPARAHRDVGGDGGGARVAAGRVRHLLLVDRVGRLGGARAGGQQAGGHVTIASVTGWEAIGTHRELCGERVFTIDAPSIGPERHAPLLVLHGFPTSSFDYAAVLDGLRAGRRVLLFDMVGYGLSAKPDRSYAMALQADVASAYVAALGIDRLALLTHDMGDTVGGELLARRAEGSWPVEVTRRVVTNGSIYIEQAHLTNGQQMLLGLPDEMLPPGIPIDAASITQSLRDTFSPATPLVPPGWPEDPVPPAAAQVVHDDGHLVLPRLIRYIEERRANERRFTGAIETDPSPLHIVWGLDDPIAVPSMVDTLLAARPDATAVRLDGVGHYPMVEAPQRFLDAALAGLV